VEHRRHDHASNEQVLGGADETRARERRGSGQLGKDEDESVGKCMAANSKTAPEPHQYRIVKLFAADSVSHWFQLEPGATLSMTRQNLSCSNWN